MNNLNTAVLESSEEYRIPHLEEFLKAWDGNYKQEVKKISIFQPSLTEKWTSQQKIYFAKIFYHARGHFHEFLWLLGNFSDDKETKELVLKNIAEEFNSSSLSHEQMYLNFAESVGAELDEEIIEQTSYLPCIKKFNKGHLRWLKNHDSDSRFAAFSAYERLDNLDYVLLWQLAKSLGVSNKGMIFFKVHMRAGHFQTTEAKLNSLWANASGKGL
jgi:pyrroloquinoline quinone (PQQ) biosynthesis protein C